ncbi:MAG: nodulation protein NfeD [Candidatus Omnitrophica bacterium]|nr:nodulation protein NfeD [Candidatus Omnitrophota bacterium]
MDGAIGPATVTYIARAIKESTAQGDQCLIVQLNTPGGLLDSTREIVQEFFAAPLPIVVYVAPAGASAASAGCFITLAADVAAMAPATTIGAAHPVEMGGGGGEQKVDSTMKQKLENFASSFIESIAVKRKRNVEWAKSAVRESASVTAEQALKLKVIEILAPDMSSLLKQLNGREVHDRILKTEDAAVVVIPMSLRERFFQMLWRPEVMFVLMLIAIYGIIGELSNPGAILPGVVGAIALILALYMAAILPINIAGLALIGLAVVLFITDVFASTHGILTAGGIAAFFLGSIMLFEKTAPAFRLSLNLIIPATLITAAFFIFVMGAGLRAQFRPVRTGKETLIGRIVPALAHIDQQTGKVFVEGEYWNAVSDAPIDAGQLVEIISIKGLTLTVKHKIQKELL